MTQTPVHDLGAASPKRRTAAALRFLTEIAAWAALGTAAAQVNLALGIAAVVVAIAIPTVFATPGDKPSAIIPVPGPVTVLILAATMAAGVVCAWIAWPAWAAIALSALTAASLAAELPRWWWLLAQ
ncbi:DUF2568 domain-containing protein [Glycomyces sp. MUSA5-2]|uniref:DUF2568 domain-containing protein n=1 Tax=Glycomyces sp. MUSA5-2 TaxID=2053002 RepID=UPI00300A426F